MGEHGTLGFPGSSGGVDDGRKVIGPDEPGPTPEGAEVMGSKPLASLDDLIQMKRAAGRPKDRAEVEILGALRDEIGA